MHKNEVGKKRETLKKGRDWAQFNNDFTKMTTFHARPSVVIIRAFSKEKY